MEGIILNFISPIIKSPKHPYKPPKLHINIDIFYNNKKKLFFSRVTIIANLLPLTSVLSPYTILGKFVETKDFLYIYIFNAHLFLGIIYLLRP